MAERNERRVVTSAERKLGYEQVFTVTEYYDGPRQGIANFNGLPHFYDCVFDEVRVEYTNSYRLTAVSPQIFDLAIEDWAIWQRWELAYHTGQTSLDSHPALPQDRARHEEIKAVLDSALKTDNENCIIRAASFEAMKTQNLPKGVMRPLQVRWMEAKSG